jgi:hypothetical protein
MHFPRRSAWLLSGVSLALLAATLTILNPVAPEHATAAPPAAPLPAEFQYVPHDAAIFLHADVASVWTSDLAKTFRSAEKTTFAKIEDQAVQLFGAKIGDLKTLTLFVPKLKEPRDSERLGVVLRFSKAFDRDKLEAGFAKLLPKNAKLKVLAPSDTLAVVLIGLGEGYDKSQPADAEGHLSPAIRAAATGKHALVAGVTFGNLPDEIQREELPPVVRTFKPILHSHAAYATLDLGKSLTLDVRVKSKRAAQALEAEKSLSVVVEMITGEITRFLPDVEKDAAGDDGLKDVVKVLKAVLTAAKGAKYSVDGTEARMTVTLPLGDLPLASAYVTGVRRVQSAAAAAQSANNLKQIALAMHNYASAYNDSFPPAAVCDKKGKPQLSWRVLILPYIEQEALYRQFKLDEPWDSAHNKKLLGKMPAVYRIPGAKADSTETHYRVFVGNGAGFEWVMGQKIGAILDGTSNTIMVATAKDAVPWTKPDELEYDPEKDPSALIGLVVNGRAQFAMMDGSVRSFTKLPSKKTLHAAITRNGGEVLGDDF